MSDSQCEIARCSLVDLVGRDGQPNWADWAVGFSSRAVIGFFHIRPVNQFVSQPVRQSVGQWSGNRAEQNRAEQGVNLFIEQLCSSVLYPVPS